MQKKQEITSNAVSYLTSVVVVDSGADNMEMRHEDENIGLT